MNAIPRAAVEELKRALSADRVLHTPEEQL